MYTVVNLTIDDSDDVAWPVDRMRRGLFGTMAASTYKTIFTCSVWLHLWNMNWHECPSWMRRMKWCMTSWSNLTMSSLTTWQGQSQCVCRVCHVVWSGQTSQCHWPLDVVSLCVWCVYAVWYDLVKPHSVITDHLTKSVSVCGVCMLYAVVRCHIHVMSSLVLTFVFLSY